MVIGRFVDWLVDSAIIRGGKVLRALDVHCRSFLTMNVWPDDLLGAELRRANVQEASGSGVSASDHAAPANASPLGPVGSGVRDTTSTTAAGGVAGEDAPQNQPHRCKWPDCEAGIADPCCYQIGERIDPELLRASNPLYADLQDRFTETNTQGREQA